MQTLSPDESRGILDAMGIPVVISRDRISVEPLLAATETDSELKSEVRLKHVLKNRTKVWQTLISIQKSIRLKLMTWLR